MRNETGFSPLVPSQSKNRKGTKTRDKVMAIRAKYPNMTESTIAWNTGVTRQRVSQILRKAKISPDQIHMRGNNKGELPPPVTSNRIYGFYPRKPAPYLNPNPVI